MSITKIVTHLSNLKVMSHLILYPIRKLLTLNNGPVGNRRPLVIQRSLLSSRLPPIKRTGPHSTDWILCTKDLFTHIYIFHISAYDDQLSDLNYSFSLQLVISCYVWYNSSPSCLHCNIWFIRTNTWPTLIKEFRNYYKLTITVHECDCIW